MVALYDGVMQSRDLSGPDTGQSSHYHPTVRVTYRTMTADIDQALAPLIAALWRLGITTTGCCQEIHPSPRRRKQYAGYAVIDFTARGAERFAAALCDGPAGSEARRLRTRASGSGGDASGGQRWHWRIRSHEAAENAATIIRIPGALSLGPAPWPDPAGFGDVDPFTISVFIPPGDISPLTAHTQALAGEAEHPARDAAQTWLRDRLCGGPVPAADIREIADAVGIAPRTLDRAKAALGVRSLRQGFGPGAAYLWALPEGKQS